MNFCRIYLAGFLALAAGCIPAAPPAPRAQTDEAPFSRPEPPRPTPAAPKAEVSFDTERDGRFAEFVGTKTAGMVSKVAVAVENRGQMRVQLGESTAPEDTLPLTKSLLEGARKDFPDRAITLSVFDPQGELVLKANYRPGQGVRYEVARGEHGGDGAQRPDPATRTAPAGQAGTTDKDRRFAEWAMGKGGTYLRYVEADLEHRGRLWFGVTGAVEPSDLSALTEALLQGARTEFPRRELTATVFDPEGKRVGPATLSRDGKVQWAR